MFFTIADSSVSLPSGSIYITSVLALEAFGIAKCTFSFALGCTVIPFWVAVNL